MMPVSATNSPDWVFRIFDRRTVQVKTKNGEVRKLAVIDVTTNLPFSIDVPSEVALDEVEVDNTYFASLKVYTARDVQNVGADYVDFFKVLDVDQAMEDFIKAYWLYPKYIKFELAELEPF